MTKALDLTGQRFGRLAVLRREENSRPGNTMWHCVCDCGTEKVVRGAHLTSGASTSCGCVRIERTTKHGKSVSPEYRAYYNMLKRCYYPADKAYPNYGGRGIQVCQAWRHSFKRFYADMGPRPSARHSVDRINVNGDYAPGNCRWAVAETQEHNKRPRKDSPTGVRGVVQNYVTGRYVAQIYAAGKTRRIGTFASLEEATAARKAAEDKHWNGGGDAL